MERVFLLHTETAAAQKAALDKRQELGHVEPLEALSPPPPNATHRHVNLCSGHDLTAHVLLVNTTNMTSPGCRAI